MLTLLRARVVIVLIGLIGMGLAPDEPVAPLVETVQVHAGMPVFEVRILPGPPSQAAWNLPAEAQIRPHPIGRVEITRRGEAKPFQTITVTGLGSPYNLQSTRFDDANFDGYADLLLGNEGGAKWGGYAIYFYDPASGSFVETALSREMSEQLEGNEMTFQPATRTIEVGRLIDGCQDAGPVIETFAFQGGHLRRTGQTDLVQAKEGCYEVTRLFFAGGVKEVGRRRAPERDGTME
jgi:hypothetical protein